MSGLSAIKTKLDASADLSEEEATRLAQAFLQPISVEEKVALLRSLSKKGESAVELGSFAKHYQGLATDPGVGGYADRAIDVCGTGGDGAETFNISSTVSFIVAAAGIPVFKHGNRSITSKCGSADLLESLGIRLDLTGAEIKHSLQKFNYAFFFAPNYHPAFRAVAETRKVLAQLGERSIFNLLGPLINPGKPAFQLIGVFAPKVIELYAQAMNHLALKSGAAVSCRVSEQQALDELSCAGENIISPVGKASASLEEVPDLADLGLIPCDLSDLRGGDINTNRTMLEKLLNGGWSDLPQGLIDTVLLNAGLALSLASQGLSLKEGIDKAAELLQNGAVAKWLEGFTDFNASLRKDG